MTHFFDRSALLVAPELLGWSLMRRLADGTIFASPIVEVEAYTQNDPACHGYLRQTPRNRVMFGPSGYAYVYLIYGLYHCLNVVCEVEGIPEAVLLRAAVGYRGPGILCRDLQITRELNGVHLLDTTGPLWLTPGTWTGGIVATKRVGLTQGVDLPWRFCCEGHPDVSVPPGKERLRKLKSKLRESAVTDCVQYGDATLGA